MARLTCILLVLLVFGSLLLLFLGLRVLDLHVAERAKGVRIALLELLEGHLLLYGRIFLDLLDRLDFLLLDLNKLLLSCLSIGVPFVIVRLVLDIHCAWVRNARLFC